MTNPAAIAWYDRHAASVTVEYEAHDPAVMHGWAAGLLPLPPALVLDVGAGSGRDAARLAGRGLDVVAVEPSQSLRERATALHPATRLHWLDDCLPDLPATYQLGLRFDLLWLSAVWQHVPPVDRTRAFASLIGLLKPGGHVLLTLRHGPAAAERAMHPVSVEEIERLAQLHDLSVVRVQPQGDQRTRPGVSWTGVALRMDGGENH